MSEQATDVRSLPTGTKANFGRAFKILGVLEGWKALHFVDSMVSVRVNKLRTRLTDELKEVKERSQELYLMMSEEYGTLDPESGQKVLRVGTRGAFEFEKEQNKLLEGGEIFIAEQFREKQLKVRNRDPETGRISEYLVALSADDIEALGEGELIILGGE